MQESGNFVNSFSTSTSTTVTYSANTDQQWQKNVINTKSPLQPKINFQPNLAPPINPNPPIFFNGYPQPPIPKLKPDGPPPKSTPIKKDVQPKKEKKVSPINTKFTHHSYLKYSHHAFWEMADGFAAIGFPAISQKDKAYRLNIQPAGKNFYKSGSRSYKEHILKMDIAHSAFIKKTSPALTKKMCLILRIFEKNNCFIDTAPFSLEVMVNNKKMQVGNDIPVANTSLIPRQQPRAVELTNESGIRNKMGPTSFSLTIKWRKYDSYNCTDFGFVMFIANRTHIADATKKLSILPVVQTEEQISVKFKSSGGLQVTEQTCKLKCPFTMCRIAIPVRFVKCTHVDCFDAKTYFQMNWKRPTSWQCPVCAKRYPIEDLRICMWTQNVLKATDSETKEVYLTKTGGWKLKNDTENWKRVEGIIKNFRGN